MNVNDGKAQFRLLAEQFMYLVGPGTASVIFPATTYTVFLRAVFWLLIATAVKAIPVFRQQLNPLVFVTHGPQLHACIGEAPT